MSAPAPVFRHLLDLPDDILFLFFSYCDVPSVARLARTCRRLNALIEQDCLWARWENKFTIIGRKMNKPCSVKEMCRTGENWKQGIYTDLRVINHRKQLPWIQLTEDSVWISDRSLLKCYKPYRQKRLDQVKRNALVVSSDNVDICRFRCKKKRIVCGCRNGTVSVYNSESCKLIGTQQHCHESDVQDVDFVGSTIVTGSRDLTTKVWSLNEEEDGNNITLDYCARMQDRVWCVAVEPDARSFAVGTAAVTDTSALCVWDLERGEQIRSYGDTRRRGAGVLDIQYESADILLSCGYDTAVRMWDLRTPHMQSVLEWEDPFDSTVYCVKSDGDNHIVSGTSRYGVVRLWDKRCTKDIQMYYTGRANNCNSPVFSLAFNSSHLYVALDLGINVLDFSVYKSAK